MTTPRNDLLQTAPGEAIFHALNAHKVGFILRGYYSALDETCLPPGWKAPSNIRELDAVLAEYKALTLLAIYLTLAPETAIFGEADVAAEQKAHRRPSSVLAAPPTLSAFDLQAKKATWQPLFAGVRMCNCMERLITVARFNGLRAEGPIFQGLAREFARADEQAIPLLTAQGREAQREKTSASFADAAESLNAIERVHRVLGDKISQNAENMLPEYHQLASQSLAFCTNHILPRMRELRATIEAACPALEMALDDLKDVRETGPGDSAGGYTRKPPPDLSNVEPLRHR